MTSMASSISTTTRTSLPSLWSTCSWLVQWTRRRRRRRRRKKKKPQQQKEVKREQLRRRRRRRRLPSKFPTCIFILVEFHYLFIYCCQTINKTDVMLKKKK